MHFSDALPAWLNLSAPHDADDPAALLAEAQRNERTFRANGQRESARDAHMAVVVWQREVGRRAALHTSGHACDSACWYAVSGTEQCVCACGGAQHGSRRRTLVAAGAGRDPFARIPQTDDSPF